MKVSRTLFSAFCIRYKYCSSVETDRYLFDSKIKLIFWIVQFPILGYQSNYGIMHFPKLWYKLILLYLIDEIYWLRSIFSQVQFESSFNIIRTTERPSSLMENEVSLFQLLVRHTASLILWVRWLTHNTGSISFPLTDSIMSECKLQSHSIYQLTHLLLRSKELKYVRLCWKWKKSIHKQSSFGVFRAFSWTWTIK